MRPIQALLTLFLNLLSALTGRRIFETWAFALLCATGSRDEAAKLAAAMLASAEDESGQIYFLDFVVPEEIREEVWETFSEASAA